MKYTLLSPGPATRVSHSRMGGKGTQQNFDRLVPVRDGVQVSKDYYWIASAA